MVQTPAARFAARLAILLNRPDADGMITIEPWLVEQEVLGILIEPYYLAAIVGAPEMGLRMPRGRRPKDYPPQDYAEAQNAAEKWLRLVLDRPMRTHGRRETHTAHELLADLVRAGNGIDAADLARSNEAVHPPDIVPAACRGFVTALRALLAKQGNDAEAAGWARAHIGPLYLHAKDCPQEVIDPLSIWQAIGCAPQKTRERPRRDMDETVKRFIKGVETANKHWDALRRLKLSPPDWIAPEDWEEDERFTTLNTNQAMSAIRMVSRATALAEARGEQTPTQDDYRSAWEEAPVSRRVSFDDFQKTPAGRAILTRTPVSTEAYSETHSDTQSETEKSEAREAVSEADMFQTLDRLRETGKLSDLDWALTVAIAQGRSLQGLFDEIPEMKMKFQTFDALSNHVAALLDRLDDLIR